MKIDLDSVEFKAKLQETIKYTDDVVYKHGFVYNEDNEINKNIQIGLTRNKMIYGEYFCPCFMVMGNTQEERLEDKENRLCPCEPARTKEIPSQGHCHCAIFCDPKFTKEQDKKEEKYIPKDLQVILDKPEISSYELKILLDARNEDRLNFKLIDVRELLEERNGRIPDTDMVLPTSQFFAKVDDIKDFKDIPVVVYCHSGSRSAQVCSILRDRFEFSTVINLASGIMGCGYLE